MASVFALVTSIAFAFDFYFVRKGLMGTPYPLISAFLTLTINFSFFIVLSLIFKPISLSQLNLIYFYIIAGILAPGVARFLSHKGLETLGMSISVPIINAEPIFAALMALIFLAEPIDFLIGTGIFCAITGLVLLSYESGQGKRINVSRKFRYRYLFYPITASIFYGVSIFFRKKGLNMLGSPITGATITTGTSWCILLIILVANGTLKKLSAVKKQSIPYFIMAGGASSIGWISLFYALHIGKVVIVSPLANLSTLITLILGFTLLRDTEQITFKVVIAGILVVGGVILLSLAN